MEGLNSDLDLTRLSQRLVDRIAETLGIDRIALFLPVPGAESGQFAAYAFGGLSKDGARPIVSASTLAARLMDGQTVVIDDPLAARRLTSDETATWRDAGFFSFVPCVSNDLTIAVIGVGRFIQQRQDFEDAIARSYQVEIGARVRLANGTGSKAARAAVTREAERRNELRNEISSDTRDTALLVAAGLIAGLTGALLLFSGLISSMRRPLEELVDAAGRLAGGDRSARVEVGGLLEQGHPQLRGIRHGSSLPPTRSPGARLGPWTCHPEPCRSAPRVSPRSCSPAAPPRDSTAPTRPASSAPAGPA